MKPTASRKERSVLRKACFACPNPLHVFSTATVAISDILSKANTNVNKHLTKQEMAEASGSRNHWKCVVSVAKRNQQSAM